jgi:hypothetical protein
MVLRELFRDDWAEHNDQLGRAVHLMVRRVMVRSAPRGCVRLSWENRLCDSSQFSAAAPGTLLAL